MRFFRFSLGCPFALCAGILLLLSSASVVFSAQNVTESMHPQWSKNLAIYEVNLRQYTPGGTFKEFESHLPRLQDMGVGILWFMPINPIGEKNRKGSLGSYYSVKDYLSVNPEFGTMDEFKSLVKKIHERKMFVILDWVGNHTAWDNALITEHPDWYTKDSTGSIVSPVPDWKDVADLNYDQLGLRNYMLEALKFWVRETDIDGYRFDVAGMVPMEFWDTVRVELNKIKPVFLLAEDENPACHKKAFDMTYSWELLHLMKEVATAKKGISDLTAYFEKNAKNYPRDAIRMNFTSNHDENSWNGTEYERLGDGATAFAVLAATTPGMPLVYTGQEACLNKRLRFFDKDTVDWTFCAMDTLYRALLQLKRENPALWNGNFGGQFSIIPTTAPKSVFAFQQQQDTNQVLVILNLSPASQSFQLLNPIREAKYTDFFSKKETVVSPKLQFSFKPWDYRVFITDSTKP